jgi:hypothetical protein
MKHWNTPTTQKGMTGLGWLTVIALVLFFALLIVKLVPTYIENYSIRTILHSLNEDPLITQQSPAHIREILHHRLQINSVYDMKDSAIHIEKSSGVLRVEIVYEVRKPMFGNIDVVMSFDNKLEVVAH